MNRPYVIIHTHTSIDGNLNIMDAGISESEPAADNSESLGSKEIMQFLLSSFDSDFRLVPESSNSI